MVGRAARMRVSVGDRTGIVQGHVEVNPHENAFAAQVAGVEAGQGTLSP